MSIELELDLTSCLRCAWTGYTINTCPICEEEMDIEILRELAQDYIDRSYGHSDRYTPDEVMQLIEIIDSLKAENSKLRGVAQFGAIKDEED